MIFLILQADGERVLIHSDTRVIPRPIFKEAGYLIADTYGIEYVWNGALHDHVMKTLRCFYPNEEIVEDPAIEVLANQDVIDRLYPLEAMEAAFLLGVRLDAPRHVVDAVATHLFDIDTVRYWKAIKWYFDARGWDFMQAWGARLKAKDTQP